MATFLFGNNAISALAGAITNVATTANLLAGTGILFPSPGANEYFALTFVDAATGLRNEIVHVTAISGDTITIVRGQEGTDPQNWIAGDKASNLVTAGTMQALVQDPELQVQPGNYATDSGSANAMVITLVPAPASRASMTGSAIRVKKSGAANTGAVTLTMNGTTTTPVVHGDGSALNSGELPAGCVFTVVYDGSNQFQLQSVASPGGITEAQLQIQDGNYAIDSGSANALQIDLDPVPASLSSLIGAPLRVKKGAAANTSSSTLEINGFTATDIVHPDGSDVLAGELPANGVFSAVYDGSNIVLQSGAGSGGGNAGQIQSQDGNYISVDGGTTNAMVGTYDPAISAHLPGAPLRIQAAHANTGAVTFNDGAGALPVVDRNGAALTTGAIVAGQIVELFYNTAMNKFQMPVSMRPSSTAAMRAGTETQSFVTPDNFNESQYALHAAIVVSISGTTPSIVTQLNAASVTRIAAGHYQVSWSNQYMGIGVGSLDVINSTAPNWVTSFDTPILSSGTTDCYFRALGGTLSDPPGFCMTVH